MKLLYIANQRLPTEKAYGRQISKMCEAFAGINNPNRGLEVELLTPARKNQIKEDVFSYYNVAGIFKVKKIYSPDFYFPGGLDKISFWLKNIISAIALGVYALRSKADIIYSRDELPLYFLSFFRKNLVFEIHKLQRARRFMYRRFCNIRGVVAITQALKNDLGALGVPADNILVAPDGVDGEAIQQEETNPVDKSSAREDLRLPIDHRIIVYAGSFYRWKGVYVLADAAKLLPDLLFIFVGGDKRGDEAELRRYLEKNNINNVKITGYVTSEAEIRKYLSAADVLILPNTAKDKVSEKYTSPLKLFEYMASGRPIVASDLSSIREILNSDNSVLIKPDDSKNLAEAVKLLLTDSELSNRISRQAFSDVKNYTWQKRAERILNFIT